MRAEAESSLRLDEDSAADAAPSVRVCLDGPMLTVQGNEAGETLVRDLCVKLVAACLKLHG